MIFTKWYHKDESLPDHDGYYLVFEDISLGNDNQEVRMAYFHVNDGQFTEHRMKQTWVNATYWSDVYSIDFEADHTPTTDGAKIAQANVVKAIDNYELIMGLTS